ncbi:MAG TPA: hypothetical protein DEP48_04250 [Persephonella sp.]|uniref:Uncharacterized protein n=1 Tax=Persephonella marina (strain DSM 14350 / EX-H1) TaxID=123214 RepID=C0QQA1_PERMH|nr:MULTISPECIES: hypothetical protein [Persephonella]ACO03608.1 hypothetical protein PERMA_1061 [Persephonella marina EX-H1]HCB69547.1 hypothetical protein [Persephonella sp.]
MKKFFITTGFIVITGSVIYTSCGGGGGGGETVPPASQITSTEQAEQAISGSTLLIAPQNSIGNMFNGNTQSVQSVLSVQILNPTSKAEISSSKKIFIPAGLTVYLSERVKDSILKSGQLSSQQSQSICDGTVRNCTIGGNWKCSGTIDETNEIYDINFEFNSCQETDITIHGTGSLKGNRNDGYTFKVNKGFKLSDTSAEVEVLQTLTVYGKYSENTAGTEGTATTSINGKIRAVDKSVTPNITYESTISNFKNSISWKEIKTQTEDKESITMTTDGSISYSETDGTDSLSLEYKFYSFKRSSTIDYINHTESLSVSGKVYINYTPDVCFEGTYQFSTIYPITYDYWTDEFRGGIIEINGARYRFFTENGITKVEITIDGQSEIKSLDELEGVCSI